MDYKERAEKVEYHVYRILRELEKDLDDDLIGSIYVSYGTEDGGQWTIETEYNGKHVGRRTSNIDDCIIGFKEKI